MGVVDCGTFFICFLISVGSDVPSQYNDLGLFVVRHRHIVVEMGENATGRTAPRLRLRISAAAETILRGGHPWLFAESIREQNREGRLGELGVIYDRKDQFLAVGLFDPESPIRLRVLHAGKPCALNREWWRARLEQALARRTGLFDERTNGYRWINGESDRWPGLVLDRYADTLVVKLYTAAWLRQWDEILDLFKVCLAPERIVLRLSRNIQLVAGKEFGKTDGQVIHGPGLDGPVVFRESGLRFESDVLRGQKTGFFLDQRENRRIVGDLALGRNCLNAFSFSGGFSLYAAAGGARSVADLDISAHALESGAHNFKLNADDRAVAACPREAIQADAFKWLAENAGRKFDLIVLDPPSLAKREAERAGAVRAYGSLATAALRHLAVGGILAACSCSAHVTSAEFFAAVRQAVSKSGRRLKELKTTFQPQDHPADFKEAEYLKAIYFCEAKTTSRARGPER
jgi:23S rRNA (cytosine1962-C5)-methyltransferase